MIPEHQVVVCVCTGGCVGFGGGAPPPAAVRMPSPVTLQTGYFPATAKRSTASDLTEVVPSVFQGKRNRIEASWPGGWLPEPL